jgi:hypothetical protein
MKWTQNGIVNSLWEVGDSILMDFHKKVVNYFFHPTKFSWIIVCQTLVIDMVFNIWFGTINIGTLVFLYEMQMKIF